MKTMIASLVINLYINNEPIRIRQQKRRVLRHMVHMRPGPRHLVVELAASHPRQESIIRHVEALATTPAPPRMPQFKEDTMQILPAAPPHCFTSSATLGSIATPAYSCHINQIPISPSPPPAAPSTPRPSPDHPPERLVRHDPCPVSRTAFLNSLMSHPNQHHLSSTVPSS